MLPEKDRRGEEKRAARSKSATAKRLCRVVESVADAPRTLR